MTAEPPPEYQVGKGKPPLHSRFKPGNPGGRPPPRDMPAVLRAGLAKQVVVTGKNGKNRRIAKRDLGIARLADRFAEGDPAAIKLYLGLLLEFERRHPAEAVERPPFEETDKLVIEDLVARIRGE